MSGWMMVDKDMNKIIFWHMNNSKKKIINLENITNIIKVKLNTIKEVKPR